MTAVYGLDSADQRFYASSYGRFNTADPYNGSAGPGDPGSWNRYSYVQGDPANANDSSGLQADFCAAEFSAEACHGSDFMQSNGNGGIDGTPLGGRACSAAGRVDAFADSACIIYLAASAAGNDSTGTSNPPNPCDQIGTDIGNTIQGVGMPGGKSLLTRVVEQIVGQGGDVYSKHEEEIEGLRNRLKKLRKNWNDNDCGDPPGGVGEWILGTNPKLVRAAHDAYQAGRVLATSYALYRIIRLLPSLLPPLWPTLPANVAIP